MTFTDYYELLQIASTADADIVSAAYKRMAMKYHPDTGGPNKSEDTMKLLNEAREVLGDTNTRANYDRVWEQENNKKEKIKIAKFLLDQKKYEEAKAVLIGLDHPTAYKWLGQIDKILADQRAKQQREANTHNSTPPKSSTYSTPPPPPPPPRARSYSTPPPPPPSPDFDALAEERIQEIRRREEAKALAEQQEFLHRQQKQTFRNQEQQKLQNYKEVLLRTYEKIDAYAFQWEGSEDATKDFASVPNARARIWTANCKVKAWKAIKAKRYEEARFFIKQASYPDQNMYDWKILVDFILDRETTDQKIQRLGEIGFLYYPIDIGASFSFRVGTLLIVIIVVSLLLVSNASNFLSAFICVSIPTVVFMCWAIYKILHDR